MTAQKADHKAAFDALKPVFGRHLKRLAVKADTKTEYTLTTKIKSPFPQHKGQLMWFGSVRIGKAYVSLHLLPLYMDAALTKTISPALKKRMQGKACFNFKGNPEPETLAELERLTEASLKEWAKKGWA